jgi:hypothetical protein
MKPLGACAQHWTLSLAAAAAAAFSPASRSSARPRAPQRVTAVAARVTFDGGSERDLGRAELHAPIERALRFLVGATGAAALALVLAR